MSGTDPPAPHAQVRRAGSGEAISAAGVEHLFRLSGADTAQRLALEEFELAPGTMGARPHIHRDHDEYFYVIAGTLTVHDGTSEIEVQPGDLAAAPRGAAHGFRNAGKEPVRGICIFSPAGYEQYFRDVHRAAADGMEITDELLADLRANYGTESL